MMNFNFGISSEEDGQLPKDFGRFIHQGGEFLDLFGNVCEHILIIKKNDALPSF